MAKTTYKAKCEAINQNTGRSSVMFTIGGEIVPATEPGKPPTMTAKTMIAIHEAEAKKVSGFEIGKTYTITIE